MGRLLCMFCSLDETVFLRDAQLSPCGFDDMSSLQVLCENIFIRFLNGGELLGSLALRDGFARVLIITLNLKLFCFELLVRLFYSDAGLI